MSMALPCRSQLVKELQSLALCQQALAKIDEDKIYFKRSLCAYISLLYTSSASVASDRHNCMCCTCLMLTPAPSIVKRALLETHEQLSLPLYISLYFSLLKPTST